MSRNRGISKLKRDFLAALPVVAPYESIRYEMMLHKVKPVCYFCITPEREVSQDVVDVKDRRDCVALDGLVAKGQLIKRDVVLSDKLIYRYYAQNEYAKELDFAVAVSEGRITFEDRSPFSRMGNIFGYRKRDIFFFHLFVEMPKTIKDAIWRFNPLAKNALRDKMLENMGYDVAAWQRDFKRGAAIEGLGVKT